MAYINLDLAFPRHPKTRRLVGLLGRGAEMLLIRLWCYCGEHHCETGALTGYSEQEIETIVEWWGAKGVAVDAMVKVGFLVKDEKGGYHVKDWLEHSGHLRMLKVRAKANAEKRWRKIQPEDSHDFDNQDATSIASSNASGTASSNAPSMPSKHSNRVPKSVAVQIAQQFIFIQKGRKEDEYDIASEIEAMLDVGVHPSAILAEVNKPPTARDYSERFFHLKRRVDTSKSPAVDAARPADAAQHNRDVIDAIRRANGVTA